MKKSAGVGGILLAVAIAPACTNAQTNALTGMPDSNRHGLFNALDLRSSYGQGVFPEPFIIDDSDLEQNEARLDWFRNKVGSATGDEATAEIEKGFGLMTVEAELHYERDSEDGNVVDGIGNIDLGVRYPFYQFVSENGFMDTTAGAGMEFGIPVHSSVSKNAEFVPKIFNDLRLGQHVTLEAITGYSMLFGPGEQGGAQTWEYGFDLGYSITREQLRVSHVQRLIPLLEMSGETALNHGESGRTSLVGLAGFRVDLDTIGPVQPRLGFGFIFPMNNNARADVHWGIATSLVFEY